MARRLPALKAGDLAQPVHTSTRLKCSPLIVTTQQATLARHRSHFGRGRRFRSSS
jgi:hypothetical protein